MQAASDATQNGPPRVAAAAQPSPLNSAAPNSNSRNNFRPRPTLPRTGRFYVIDYLGGAGKLTPAAEERRPMFIVASLKVHTL
jgi:hypothetical protein